MVVVLLVAIWLTAGLLAAVEWSVVAGWVGEVVSAGIGDLGVGIVAVPV
jgi:hypothetical protein